MPHTHHTCMHLFHLIAYWNVSLMQTQTSPNNPPEKKTVQKRTQKKTISKYQQWQRQQQLE